MRTLLVSLALFATVFAGCASEAPVEAEPEIFNEIETGTGLGVIRGLIVDDAITPVGGATINAQPGELQTTSDEEGAFVFTDLEPGVYFLTASAPDHDKTQVSVSVEADIEKPEITRILIAYIPPPVPYIQELTTNFFMDASASVAGSGVVLGNVIGEGTFTGRVDIDANTTWIHSELVWEAQHPLVDRMQIDGSSSDGVSKRSIGTNPLVQAYTDEEVTPATNSMAWTLFVEDSSLAPVGVTASQRLTMYTFGFHEFLPDEGWVFSDDGAHAVPPS